MDAAMLDTDTLNEVLKRRNPQVVRHAADYLLQRRQFAISAITRYELLRGLKEKGAIAQIVRFDQFCQRSRILPINDSVLDRAFSCAGA